MGVVWLPPLGRLSLGGGSLYRRGLEHDQPRGAIATILQRSELGCGPLSVAQSKFDLTCWMPHCGHGK